MKTLLVALIFSVMICLMAIPAMAGNLSKTQIEYIQNIQQNQILVYQSKEQVINACNKIKDPRIRRKCMERLKEKKKK